MKKMFLALCACFLMVGCQRPATFQRHGRSVLTVDAESAIITKAIWNTANSMTIAQWKVGGEGKRTTADDPDFAQSFVSWKDESDQTIGSRGLTKFLAKDETRNEIERISIKSKSTIIILKSDDDRSTMNLCNELIKQLRALGVIREKLSYE
ncbi:MAG: hypothetical protein ACYSYV_09075 [Planctomycetota bacterium]|jgi:hypothetical protein